MKTAKTIKRCFNFIFMVLLVLTLFPCGFTIALADQLPESAVILFSESHTDDELSVTATLQKNPGISDAIFEIKYDNKALTLISYEKGDALNSLDFIASQSVETYPFKFLFSPLVSVKTDKTTGVLFTLHFKVKDTAKNGQYIVGVESSVDYWGNGYEQDVNVISDTAKFNIVNKQIVTAVVESDSNTGTGDPQNPNKLDTILIIAIVATVVTVAILVTAITLIIIKRKRNKGAEAWIKL